MTYALGLTGSIGMGKSTTTGFFAEAGVPVWDADAAVHRLYAPGGAAVAPMARLRPDAVGESGVDRSALKAWIAEDDTALSQIEAIVHPLVAEDRAAFKDKNKGAGLLLFDIPLLFETGADEWLDGVLVVTAAPEVQRERVLARPDMTEEMFDEILSRQVPDAEKRARADFVIETKSLEQTRAEVETLIATILGGKDA